MPYFNESQLEQSIIALLQEQGLSLYQENRHTLHMLMDGFSLKREDVTKQNLYIYPIAFDEANQRHNIY